MKKYNILFCIYLFALFLSINTIVDAQDNNWDFEERNVISIYWTTLNQEEKKIYLFSYMTQVYETYDALKKELSHFVDSVNNVSKPETDGESAAKALKIALTIQQIIDQ